MAPRIRTKTPGVFAYPTAKGDRFMVRYRDVRGKPKEHGSIATYAEARAIKKAIDGDRVQGRDLLRRNTLTYGEYFDRWWATHSPAWRVKTRKQYRYLFDIHVLPFFAQQRIDRILPSDVKAFVSHLATKPQLRDKTKTLSRATINHAKGKFGEVLIAAIADGLITHNPSAGVRTAKAQAAAKKALPVGQVEQLADILDKRYRPAVFLMAYAGLRPCEAAGLRPCDIDLDAATVAITASVVEGDGRNEETKTAVARTIPITDAVLEELKPWLTGRAQEPLLRAPRGGIFRLSQFRASLDRAKKRDNSPLPSWVTPYSLRHTCATILARKNVPVHVAAAYMGHDPAVFLRTYAHLFEHDLAGAAAAISDHRDDNLAPIIPIDRARADTA